MVPHLRLGSDHSKFLVWRWLSAVYSQKTPLTASFWHHFSPLRFPEADASQRFGAGGLPAFSKVRKNRFKTFQELEDFPARLAHVCLCAALRAAATVPVRLVSLARAVKRCRSICCTARTQNLCLSCFGHWTYRRSGVQLRVEAGQANRYGRAK